MSKRSTAVLDTPEPGFASESSYPRSTSTKTGPRLRRDSVEDFAEGYGDSAVEADGRPRQQTGGPRSQLKLKFRSRIPTSVIGRVFTGLALLAILGAVAGLLMVTRTFLLHDGRFMIQSPAAIEIQGNKHLTRAQLLTIFGEDVERNIFRISLDDRQAALEALPWVQHATIMRLLPGRIRVAIVERTPVAFVRQGGHIGLVDGHGMLLDMAPGSETEPSYSFPVVTGILAADPASTRSARMKIFERFTADLDSTGEKISEHLSEVDLSNPEDVKALIPDHSTEVLVHFGDDHFLDRYRKFQELLPQWHTQYPNLASVDMRYEREVVLDMARPGKTDADSQSFAGKQPAPRVDSVAKPLPLASHPADHPKPVVHLAAAPIRHPFKSVAHTPGKAAPRPVAHPIPHTASKPVAQNSAPPAVVHPAAVPPAVSLPSAATTPSASAAARSGYPADHTVTAPKPAAAKPAAPKPTVVHPAAVHPAALHPAAAKTPEVRPSGGKPSAGKPLVSAGSYHPPQVPTP